MVQTVSPESVEPGAAALALCVHDILPGRMLLRYSSAPSGGVVVVGEDRLGLICKEIQDRKAKFGEQQIKNNEKLTDSTQRHDYEPLHLCTLSSYISTKNRHAMRN